MHSRSGPEIAMLEEIRGYSPEDESERVKTSYWYCCRPSIGEYVVEEEVGRVFLLTEAVTEFL